MKSIPKLSTATGVIPAPPSKSYTARALLLAAMAEGETRVVNALDSDDSRYMLEAIRTIGYEVSGTLAKGVVIGPRTHMSANEMEIFIGNAGTAMRFLTGFLAFTPGRYLLKGEERMHQRPIGDLADVLASIGVEVEYAGAAGYPPLRIRGKKMRGGWEVAISGETSSQFVSSLMMGGATLPGGIVVDVSSLASQPYVDITRDVLTRFGATVIQQGGRVSVRAARLECAEYRVEGDFSSASYWFAAAAATGGTITVSGLNRQTAQGDARFLDILSAMGCRTAWQEDRVTVYGPAELRGGTFDCNDTPDIVPTLAAIAPLAGAPVEITNVANLRVKESDRIATVASELRKLDATVEERADGLVVHPGWSDAPATIDTHNDHRIAMAFAIAGLARGNVTIENEQVVSKSYPRFWRTLDELVAASA
jgi:3-phosphoshikimate 1-carboxyvinyltransferase